MHGVQPAQVGLVAACFCLLLRVVYLTTEEFTVGVSIRTCLYVAGILGLAAVFVDTSLERTIGRALLSLHSVDPPHPSIAYGSPVAWPMALAIKILAIAGGRFV